MRKIKFRAFCKRTHEMYDVIKMLWHGTEIEFQVGYYENPSWGTRIRKAGDIELMQYTGLKDKAGKEIYEHDIVEITAIDEKGRTEKLKGNVSFERFEYCVITETPSWPCVSWSCIIVSEVIGNIYESPELLDERMAK